MQRTKSFEAFKCKELSVSGPWYASLRIYFVVAHYMFLVIQ